MFDMLRIYQQTVIETCMYLPILHRPSVKLRLKLQGKLHRVMSSESDMIANP